MYSLYQTTNQLIDVEANPLHISLDDTCAVLELYSIAPLFVRGPASLLSVRLALVLENDFLYLVAVWILINTISSHISLSNIRIILLNWRGCWILWRWWRRTITTTSRTLSRKNIPFNAA